MPDKADLAVAKPVPKMRNKTSAGSRPRPKTIHVDSGGVTSDMQEGILSPSRSKKGSTSNLTGTVRNGSKSVQHFNTKSFIFIAM